MVVGPADQYCRAIEAYLCRKNDGHLIRIVGPAFEQVLGWANQGVPIKIACQGIDRYFERYYAKGPRRRPVRIEFCEADVLDAFDEWRRAVGIAREERLGSATMTSDSGSSDSHERRHGSLPAHLDRIIARLTTLRAGADRSLDDALDAAIRELDGRRSEARSLRGEGRRELVDRLRAMDRELMQAAEHRCDAATRAQLDVEAAEELAPFKDRLPGTAFEEARRGAVARLVRERYRLPVIAFED
ncbi:MAG TPA: hypothetical protein VFB92_05735 [Vicinamibacterales bacterium]|nr:hypothetical protein [Vicinamibacterales bacterium]